MQEFSLFVVIYMNLPAAMGVMHEVDDAYSIRPGRHAEHLVVLLAGPISHTSTPYIDLLKF